MSKQEVLEKLNEKANGLYATRKEIRKGKTTLEIMDFAINLALLEAEEKGIRYSIKLLEEMN
jgi:hypothetical protein